MEGGGVAGVGLCVCVCVCRGLGLGECDVEGLVEDGHDDGVEGLRGGEEDLFVGDARADAFFEAVEDVESVVYIYIVCVYVCVSE